MHEEARLHPGEYKFVINAGDNFYPFGIDSPDHDDWQRRWGDMYARAKHTPPTEPLSPESTCATGCRVPCPCMLSGTPLCR